MNFDQILAEGNRREQEAIRDSVIMTSMFRHTHLSTLMSELKATPIVNATGTPPETSSHGSPHETSSVEKQTSHTESYIQFGDNEVGSYVYI